MIHFMLLVVAVVVLRRGRGGDGVARTGAPFRRGDAGEHHGKLHVLERGHRRDQMKRLEQNPDLAAAKAREPVLVEGAHPETEHLLVGRMARQAPDVDGQILINDGTAAPGIILDAATVKRHIRARRSRSLFLIDIAVKVVVAILVALVALVALFFVYDWIGSNLLDTGGTIE